MEFIAIESDPDFYYLQVNGLVRMKNDDIKRHVSHNVYTSVISDIM